MKKLIILILFFLSSCGYQPLYSNKNSEIYTFSEMELLGNKEINRRIISAISIKEDKQNFKFQKIILKNEKRIIETSKDSKGQPNSFKMIVNLKFSIIDNEKTLKEKNIEKEFSYKNLDNKFDLSEYEINVQNNLTDRIIDELVIYLNL